ncbi:MAG: hypothetical protein WDZ40_00635 [Candidatus Spechtbacterales bacterium]
MALGKKTWPFLVLILLLALGAFFRLHKLDTVPPGIYPDEAKNANDAVETLQTGEYELFYPENNGREGLYVWMIASSFQYNGINIPAVRMVSAIIGILTILGTYLFTREIFIYKELNDPEESKIGIAPIARETIALLAAGFLAVSFWHINFSRIGFRAILVPMLLSFAMWLTLKALRPIGPSEYSSIEKKSLWAAIFAGLFWGAGFHTYIAFRIAYGIPLFMISAAFIVYLFRNKPRLSWEWVKEVLIRDRWINICAMFTAMFLAMAPMLLHFANNREDFISRATGISVFDEPTPVIAFLKSLGLHMQMFFFRGDANWRHNLSTEPQLLLPVGILFILGLIYSFLIMKDGVKHKNSEAIVIHLTLLAALGAMMLPGALTAEGVPHALRVIGMMPFVFVYAAFGFLYFLRIMFPHTHHRAEIWPFALGTAVVMILVIASFQYRNYFIDWGKNTETEHAFSKGYVEIGKYFNSQPLDVQKYLIVNGGGIDVTYPQELATEGALALFPDCLDCPRDKELLRLPMSAQTTLFVQRTKQSTLDYSFYGSEIPIQSTKYIRENQLPAIIEGQTIFVPLSATDEIKEKLRTSYPLGEEIQFEYFWAWQINI